MKPANERGSDTGMSLGGFHCYGFSILYFNFCLVTASADGRRGHPITSSLLHSDGVLVIVRPCC